MLVIDDNKLKLLRMKEKLLEVSSGNDAVILSEYKNIIIDIDNKMYESLINMIKNANYRNLPLEEQLDFLTNLESEYDSFNEFQCRYRDVYEKYASDKLELSLISDIYIDKIREKNAAINGYLINNKNLLKYRDSLEKLNVELIEAEKKKEAIASKFMSLEQTLKSNVLNAEGRIETNNGNLEYTSIIKEFSTSGFDLIELLDNGSLLEQELSKTNSLLSSEEEKMEAAKVCFKSMPNTDTKKMYDTSFIDVIKAKYRLTLLKLADLVAKEFDNYDEIKNKRIQIINLVKDRIQYLSQLGSNLLIDPFDRLKINEQLEIIDLLGNSIQNVSLVKEKIKNTYDIVEDVKNKNNELFIIINQDVELFHDRKSISHMVQEFNIEVEHVSHDFDVNHQNDEKIINIKKIPVTFNIELVREKTNGVIARVYELVTNVSVNIGSDSVAPQLVIEKDNSFENEDSLQQIVEPVPSLNDNLSNDNNSFDDNLFEEVEPFEKVALFSSKADDVFLDDSVNDNQNEENDIMPELFFDDMEGSFDSEKIENDVSNVLSFDEQIEKLMSDDSSKKKKLVA